MGYDKKIRRVDLDMYDADALLKVMKDKKIDTKDIIKTTGLSLRTIDRYLAPNNKDIVKESTLRLIILACGENYETFVNEEIKKNKQSLGNKEVTDETEEETQEDIQEEVQEEIQEEKQKKTAKSRKKVDEWD